MLCCFCKNLLKHNRTTSGTAHLHDHVTHCSQNPGNRPSRKSKSRPLTAFLKTSQQLSQPDQEKLLDASIECIAPDIRPFKATEDPVFKCMADCLVQLGAKYGHFDGIMPCHPGTLLNDMLFKRQM